MGKNITRFKKQAPPNLPDPLCISPSPFCLWHFPQKGKRKGKEFLGKKKEKSFSKQPHYLIRHLSN
jgi:hypothetical protein